MKKISLFITATILATGLNAQGLGSNHGNIGSGTETGEVKPKYQGVILEILEAGQYSYLKIDEKNAHHNSKELGSFWIVVDITSAKVGDYVRFQKELVTKNFKSKTLNRDFDELMFASQLEYRVSK